MKGMIWRPIEHLFPSLPPSLLNYNKGFSRLCDFAKNYISVFVSKRKCINIFFWNLNRINRISEPWLAANLLRYCFPTHGLIGVNIRTPLGISSYKLFCIIITITIIISQKNSSEVLEPLQASHPPPRNTLIEAEENKIFWHTSCAHAKWK